MVEAGRQRIGPLSLPASLLFGINLFQQEFDLVVDCGLKRLNSRHAELRISLWRILKRFLQPVNDFRRQGST